MASANFCSFSIVGYKSTNFLKFICRYGHAYTCATDEYSSLSLSCDDTLTNKPRIIREIIERFFCLWSEINDLVSESFQVFENRFSKWESTMVTSKSNYHSFLYLLSSPSIYPITGSQRIQTKYIGSNSQRDTKPNTEANGEARRHKWAKSEVIIAMMSHLFTLKSNGLRRPQLNDRSIW
jgi:hypothetical protein